MGAGVSRWLLPLIVAVLAFAHFRGRAGFPWQLALLSGLAIGALTYVFRRTVDQMLVLLSPPGSDEDLTSREDPVSSEELVSPEDLASTEEPASDGGVRQGKRHRAANNKR